MKNGKALRTGMGKRKCVQREKAEVSQNPSLWLIMANTSDHVHAVEKAGSSP